MADTTYINQTVYNKQEGDEFVVASGGQITVESGGELEIESGGKVDVESGGEIEISSGGIFDLQSGATFYMADTSAFEVAKLKNTLYSFNTATRYINSQGAGSQVMSVSTFLPAYGIAIIRTSGTSVSALSLKLPTPSVGMILEIHASGCISNTALSLFAQSAGGASCVDLSGSVVSSINLASTAAALIKLGCFTDSIWSILYVEGHCSVNMAA